MSELTLIDMNLSDQQQFTISNCAPNIHKLTYKELSPLCEFPNLNELLKIDVCGIVDTEEFFKDCKRLSPWDRELVINSIKELEPRDQTSARDLAKWLQSAPRVMRLSLVSLFQLTSETEIDYNIPDLHQLKHIHIDSTNITANQLNQLLNKTPHLSRLDLLHMDIDQLHLKPGQLSELTELDLSFARLSLNQLKTLLLAAPNLVKLNLPYDLIRMPDDVLEAGLCPSLKELTCRGLPDGERISVDYLNKLTGTSPHLTCLNIMHVDIIQSRSDDEELFNIESLRTLKISGLPQHDQFITKILSKTPHLRELHLRLEQDLPVNWQILSYLKQLTIDRRGNQYKLRDLANTLQQIPEVRYLKITGNVRNCDRLPDDFFHLQGRQFNSLIELKLLFSPITNTELIEFLQAAPLLQTVYIELCNNISIGIDYLQQSFPDIHFIFEQKNKHSLATMNQGFRPSFSLESDANKTLPFQRVFFKNHGGGNQPPVNDDHLQICTYNVQKGLYENYIPAESDLIPCFPDIKSIDSIKPEFEKKTAAQNDATDELLAQRLVRPATADEWILLPARSTRDELLSFASSVPCEPRRDKKTGYYFIRPLIATTEPVYLSYTIRTPKNGTKWKFLQDRSRLVRTITRISRLRFNEKEELDKEQDDYKLLMQETPEVRIEGLRRFCHFYEESASDFSGTHAGLLNYFMENRVGVCRHRADLFMALAKNLGIESFCITNYVHAFNLVKTEDGQTHSVDLGGGSVNMIEQPPDEMPRTKKPRLISERLLHPTPAEQSAHEAESPFQTWKLSPLQAQNSASLTSELIQRSSIFKRQLLLIKNKFLLDELHQSLLQSEHRESCFFSPNLDSLSLESTRIHEGESSKSASPLQQFLQQAQANPQQEHTWFINWSNPQTEHGSLNSLINNDKPALNGFALPANLRIVVVMDEISAQGMGKDFYSRMESRSKAPAIVTAERAQPAESKEIDDESDVLLLNDTEWKKEILGYYSYKNEALGLMPGQLLTAMERARNGEAVTLTIHNPPWTQDDFRWFMDELQISKRFYFNGHYHQLPDNLQIRFTKPLFNFQRFKDVLVDPDAPADSSAVDELVLNARNLKSFFTTMRISHGLPCPAKGMFERYRGAGLNLMVNDTLNAAQWHKLLTEARKQRVKLALFTAPGVTLPDSWLKSRATAIPSSPALLPREGEGSQIRLADEPAAPHTPQSAPFSPFKGRRAGDEGLSRQSIKAILTNDLDFTTTIYPTDHRVPVNLNTRFESLFFHIKTGFNAQGKRQFKGEKTDLLRAIERGESVTLKGQFSTELIQHLQSLFIHPPALWVNGKRIKVRGAVHLMTKNATTLQGLAFEAVNYSAELDYQQMPETIADQLRTTFKQLKLDACHSHLKSFPATASRQRQQAWADNLIQRLEQSKGVSASEQSKNRAPTSSSRVQEEAAIATPTHPQDILNYLQHNPYVFLSSESGSGKSHQMNQGMRDYARETGQDIHIFNELSELEAWAESKGKINILFIDEANISSEDYLQFENLANGERVLWFKGKRYELSANHHVVFAGNPLKYGGRFQADLFKRFPQVLAFQGEPLDQILAPFGNLFGNHWDALFPLIKQWYNRAHESGLNITPRNAQMICLDAFVQQLSHPLMPPKVLMNYAILQQLKTLSLNKAETKPVYAALRQHELTKDQRQTLKNKLLTPINDDKSSEFIWVKSRKRVAANLISALNVRKERIAQAQTNNPTTAGLFKQDQGLNGFLLEGEQGVGKTHLITAVLESMHLAYEIINLGSPDGFKRLHEAFHAGKIVFIDEFNTYGAEKILNNYASGVDEFKQKANQPGFFMIGAQNPITFAKRNALSKALENRMIKRSLADHTIDELREIQKKRFKFPKELTNKRLGQYERDKNYAEKQRLFPAPDSRTFINQAMKDKDELDYKSTRNKTPRC